LTIDLSIWYNVKMNETKVCDDCRETLPLERFVKKNNVKSGYGNLCKGCKNERQAARRASLRPVSEFDAFEFRGEMVKKCNLCLEFIPIAGYREQDQALRSFKGTACMECNRARRRNLYDPVIGRVTRLGWKERDPVGYMESSNRRRLRTRFNLSVEEFEELLDKYSRTHCHLCNREYGVRGPIIDHDHACCPGRRSCGKCVRGIICNRCNVSLGAIEDNKDTLNNMINYLEKT
jgi:hypothetical protein